MLGVVYYHCHVFVVDVVAVAAAVAVVGGFRLRRFAPVGRLNNLASLCDPTWPMVGHPARIVSALHVARRCRRVTRTSCGRSRCMLLSFCTL